MEAVFDWGEFKREAILKTTTVLIELENENIIHNWTVKDNYWSAWYDVNPDNQFLLEGNSLETTKDTVLKQIEEVEEDYRKDLAWRIGE